MAGLARRRRKSGEDDINITAFMNLMVILVPFLLITAVFSRLAILQLNLPAAESEPTETEQLLNIEVIVRKAELQITDRGTGLLKALPNLLLRGAVQTCVCDAVFPFQKMFVLRVEVCEFMSFEPVVLDVFHARFDLAFVLRRVRLRGQNHSAVMRRE